MSDIKAGADELRIRSTLRQHGIRPDARAPMTSASETARQTPPVGADELRARAYLHRMGVVL